MTNVPELLDREALAQLRRAGMREIWRLLLDECGDISLAQAAALFFVEQEREATVNEISSAVRRSLSGTSRVVDGLVRSGFLDRQEDPADRRAKRVRLTRKAERIFARLERERRQRIARVLHAIGPEEARQVADKLELILRAFVGASDSDGSATGI